MRYKNFSHNSQNSKKYIIGNIYRLEVPSETVNDLQTSMTNSWKLLKFCNLYAYKSTYVGTTILVACVV